MAASTRMAVIGGIFALVAAVITAGATIWADSKPNSPAPRADKKEGDSGTGEKEESWKFRKLLDSLESGQQYDIDYPDDGEADFTYSAEDEGITFINDAHLIAGIETNAKPPVKDCKANRDVERLPILHHVEANEWWCMSTSKNKVIAFKVGNANPMAMDIWDIQE